MIHIFTLLTLLFLPSLSIKEINPKLCINCKHFLPNFMNNKYGKCSLFLTKNNDNYELITGNSDNKFDYYHCSVARGYEDMCGKEGRLYIKK